MNRPSTSRPHTSSGSGLARPTTAAYYPDTYDRDQQYTYSQDYSTEEEEGEESEAEDVFAFGPPATADGAPSTASAPQQLISQPSPVYDPSSTYSTFAHNVAGPSSLHTRHTYPQSPVMETPPSTNSQAGDVRRVFAGDHLESVGRGRNQKSAMSSAVSSREVHISLPPTRDQIEEAQKTRPVSSAASFPSVDSAAVSLK